MAVVKQGFQKEPLSKRVYVSVCVVGMRFVRLLWCATVKSKLIFGIIGCIQAGEYRGDLKAMSYYISAGTVVGCVFVEWLLRGIQRMIFYNKEVLIFYVSSIIVATS